MTEILARPILNMYWPSLAGFRQPLAGEFAARRQLLESLSFPVGYGVEIGTLVDTYNLIGLHGIAEVDVGQRQNAHKPLRELTTMAKAILGTAEKRLDRGKLSTGKMFLPWENDFREVDATERPPLQEYRCGPSRSPTLSPPAQDIPGYPCPPFVMIEGVRMFRDIGGAPTGVVRSGLVYRSGEPSKMTWQGARDFMKLGIKKVFDFRSPVEIHSEHSIHGADDTLHRKDSAINFDQTNNRSSTESAYSKVLLEGSVERVAVPVFRDEDWLPENRQARLKHYSSAAEVSYTLNRNATAILSIRAYNSSGLCKSIPLYARPWSACFPSRV